MSFATTSSCLKDTAVPTALLSNLGIATHHSRSRLSSQLFEACIHARTIDITILYL